METVLTIVAIIFLQIGVGSILQRKEDYEVDLESAQAEKRDAVFWGYSPEEANERIIEIQKEGYGNWARRLKFALFSWTMIVIGAASGIAAWSMAADRDPQRGFTQGLSFLLVWMFAMYLYYKHLKKIDLMEKEVAWLKRTLKAVKDRSESDNLQLRVDILGPDERSAGRPVSLGDILDQSLGKPPRH